MAMSGKELGESLGERLKEERQALDLTQAELAERWGLTQSGLSYLERGRGWNLERLVQASDLFQLTVPEFIQRAIAEESPTGARTADELEWRILMAWRSGRYRAVTNLMLDLLAGELGDS